MFGKNHPLRVAVRHWLNEHLMARGVYNMLKTRAFWREAYHVPKWLRLVRVMSHTVVPYERLSSLDDLCRTVEVPGAFVECGVFRGGCAAIMAYWGARRGRQTHFFDSFEGLPEPQAIDGARAARAAGGRTGGQMKPIGRVAAPVDDLQHLLFERFRLPRDNTTLHPGWFQDTLPALKTAFMPIAVLRLDADWYESTKLCLDNLYDHVMPGGVVIVDDYGHFEGCKKAVDEFLAARAPSVTFHYDDYSCIYFRKP